MLVWVEILQQSNLDKLNDKICLSYDKSLTNLLCFCICWNLNGSIGRLNSGIFRIFNLRVWNLDLTSSDCRASVIIWNDTEPDAVSRDSRRENSTEPSLKIQSIISVSKCDDPSDYESDDYNDSDYNYNSGNLSAKNETLLEEIIIIGNVSYSLDDLPTYNVTINLNLPEIKPLKEPVQKSKFRWTNSRSSMEPWIRNNFERWEKHLFILSTAFIDAIWKPFEEIEDFLFSLLTLQDAEQIDFVSENWKQVFFENSTFFELEF